MHADGAGNKIVSGIYVLERNGYFSLEGIAQDALIMNIDDLLCVGATDNILLSSTIGRNKNLIQAKFYRHYQWNRRTDKRTGFFGVTIHSTGGETADVGMFVYLL
jgi:phosphoribosylformylglycinamidine cyclo-ligase